MDNQQLYNLNLTNNQIQVILTGILGDGCLTQTSAISVTYTTSCKYKDYLIFKQELLEDLGAKISYVEKNGYAQNPIYTLRSFASPELLKIKNLSLGESITLMDELGLALWIYDDGSLHKDKLFYNINTQKYSYWEQVDILVPFLKDKFGITAKVTIENKKDGREFYYLRVSKYEGAYEINKILEKYPINSYKYKLWSSETILNWSKLLVELKSKGIVLSHKRLSNLLKLLEEGTMQDIVQSLEKSKAGIKLIPPTT